MLEVSLMSEKSHDVPDYQRFDSLATNLSLTGNYLAKWGCVDLAYMGKLVLHHTQNPAPN